MLGVIITYQDVDNGEVTLMFNGNQVKVNEDWRDGRKGWSYAGRTGLKSEAGENTIQVMFQKTIENRDAKAYVAIDVIDTRPQFAECEDKVNCPPLLFPTRSTFD